MENNGWDKVSLAQYIELIGILSGSENLSEEEMDDITINVVSILENVDSDTIRNMSYDDYIKFNHNVGFINTPIPTEYKTVLDINGTELHLIPFNTLEFGAFIDIEHYLTSEVTYISNLPKILSILYRQEVKPATALNAAVYETYDGWVDVRDVLMDKVSITSLYGVIELYMNWRANILKNYEGLFQEPEGQYSEEDDAEYTKGMTSTERQAFEQEKRVGKWSWMLLLVRLANNDYTKLDEVAAFPIIKALNILAMCRELKIS